MRTSRGGFTLVEMMTVIAIMAILASILLPALGRAQEQSRRTQCMANLHQIAVALKLYKLDERGYPLDLTERPIPAADAEFDYHWFGAVRRSTGERVGPGYGVAAVYPDYVSMINVFNCPDDETDRLRDSSGAYSPDPPATRAVAVAATAHSFNSYDGYDIALGELRYNRMWSNDDTASYYRRQLKWRYPPEDTVVTWCGFHRRVIDLADPAYGAIRPGDKDVIGYLDGTTGVVPTWGMMPEEGSGHRSMPGEQE